MIATYWRPLVVGFLAAIVGVLLMWLAQMLYTDHQRISTIWQIEVQRASQPQPGKP